MLGVKDGWIGSIACGDPTSSDGRFDVVNVEEASLVNDLRVYA